MNDFLRISSQGELMNPPNKYDKNLNFNSSNHKTKKAKDFPQKNQESEYNIRNFNEKYKSSQSCFSQIEIELKNMISPEETPIKSVRSPFDYTVQPLKNYVSDNSPSLSHYWRRQGSIVKKRSLFMLLIEKVKRRFCNGK